MNTRTAVLVPKWPIGSATLAGYVAIYAALLWAMWRTTGYEISEPLLVLGLLGIGFSAASWLLTVRAAPLPNDVRNPASEVVAVAVLLAFEVAFITWGLGYLHRLFPSDPSAGIVILIAKILAFVAVPVVVMHLQFGYGLRDLVPISMPLRHWPALVGMSVLLLAFQVVLGSGLRELLKAHLSSGTLLLGLPVTFVWLALEAGVVEELFFRVLLQTRLSAVLKSELSAIVVTSLLFGLAHAPGIYLRTGMTNEGLQNPSLLMAVGYSIVIVSVAGFFLGVLWARTRNFLLVVTVHAMGDLLPNLLPTMRSLRLIH